MQCLFSAQGLQNSKRLKNVPGIKQRTTHQTETNLNTGNVVKMSAQSDGSELQNLSISSTAAHSDDAASLQRPRPLHALADVLSFFSLFLVVVVINSTFGDSRESFFAHSQEVWSTCGSSSRASRYAKKSENTNPPGCRCVSEQTFVPRFTPTRAHLCFLYAELQGGAAAGCRPADSLSGQTVPASIF